MECYLAMKRNKIKSFVEMWMDLETHTEQTKSEREKKCHILLHIYGI